MGLGFRQAGKLSLGRNLDFSWEVVPQAFELVKRSLICKYRERARHILQASRKGVVFGDAHYSE